jgi:hypothetical protein
MEDAHGSGETQGLHWSVALPGRGGAQDRQDCLPHQDAEGGWAFKN